MKLIDKKRKNNKTNTLDLEGTANRTVKAAAAFVIAAVITACFSVTVFAASTSAASTATDPLDVVNNLSDFIFGLIRAVGMILLGFGIVQVGLSLKSHDASQRANGFLTLAGGIIITFAKEILDLIMR